MKTFRFSLTFAIPALLSCLLLLTWLLLSPISFKISEKDLIAQKSEQGKLLLSSFLNLLPEGLPGAGDLGAARDFSVTLSREKDFRGILIVDADAGEIFRLADSNPVDEKTRDVLRTGNETAALAGDGLSISRYAPLLMAGKVVGAARLTLSLTSEYQRLRRSSHMYMTYFLIDFILLLAIGSYLMSRLIVLPMRRLLTATERISAGDLGCRVPVPGSEEIALLAESFNKMVDVLRRKKIEVEKNILSLESMNRELEIAREETIRTEKLASVGLLAAGTAHEIGAPLSAIIGYAGILRDEMEGDKEKLDYIGRIQDEATRIDRIVRDLLDFARPLPVEPEEVDLPELLRETIHMLEGQGIFRNIEVSLAADHSLPPAYGDRHHIQQVFINLFINARDAMELGGALAIRVNRDDPRTGENESRPEGLVMGRRRDDFGGAFKSSVQRGGDLDLLRVEVRDTGAGIPGEHLERIFDPFFTTKEPGKGTGLGLAVTARIIDSMGGRITVESIPDAGSTFTVWLPAGQCK